jgi:hypothetical protein
MRILLLAASLSISVARAQEASIEKITTTKVTILWTGPEFVVESEGKRDTFPLPTRDEIYSADVRRPSIPGVEGLTFTSVAAVRNMKKEDESHFSFPDFRDRPIRLARNKPVELWKVQFTIVIGNDRSPKVVWKQQP